MKKEVCEERYEKNTYSRERKTSEQVKEESQRDSVPAFVHPSGDVSSFKEKKRILSLSPSLFLPW